MSSKIYIFLAITLMVGVIVGFFGGKRYQMSKSPNFNRGNQQREMIQGRGMGNTGARMPVRPGDNQSITGEITAIDNSSITLKAKDGGSKILILSNQTKITKFQPVDKDALTTGDQLTAFGNIKSDGTVDTISISLGEAVFTGAPAYTKSTQNQ